MFANHQCLLFSLNNTVDELFKKEFDVYREKKQPHPLMEQYNINAIPFAHADLDMWRNTFKGIRYTDKDLNITLYGGVDDVWINDKEELCIVDYKATSKDKKPSLSASWQNGYKRQVEVYQFLFRKNGFTVSNDAYFVYTNARKDKDSFQDELAFETIIIPYKGDDSWVEKTLKNIKECIDSDTIPPIGKSWKGDDCEYCTYRERCGHCFRDHIHSIKHTEKKK